MVTPQKTTNFYFISTSNWHQSHGLYMMLMNLVDRTRLQSDVFEIKLLMDLLNVKEEHFNEQ